MTGEFMFRFESIAAASAVPELDGESVSGPQRAKHLVFVDQASQALLHLLDRVAPSDAAVLIAGESGTGKELVARYIHRRSGRRGPFLAVNCGAISEHLAESELFGHESGAFTGASGRREGWFEAADGGTLFLDEIGDLPLPLQGKLLRVLQENEVTRLGSRKTTPVDVRVISASNVDLAAAVAAGNFRLDLFYRLNIVPIRLPALRDRPGDIEALARHFIGVYSKRLKRLPPALRDDALTALRRYSWPGNIRELENVIHYSLLIAAESEIRPEHLRIPGAGSAASQEPPANRPVQPPANRPVQPPANHPVQSLTNHGVQSSALDRIGHVLQACFEAPGTHLFRDIERRLVEVAYRHCGANQVRTAELLGISRNVVRTLLKRYGLLNEADAALSESIGFAAIPRPELFDSCLELSH
jgi:DNA-binding NtrC family response regulator